MAYRGPAYTYKIRTLSKNNLTGDAYGITINREIALQFEGLELMQYISGNAIIIESGNKAQIKDRANKGWGVLSEQR